MIKGLICIRLKTGVEITQFFLKIMSGSKWEVNLPAMPEQV